MLRNLGAGRALFTQSAAMRIQKSSKSACFALHISRAQSKSTRKKLEKGTKLKIVESLSYSKDLRKDCVVYVTGINAEQAYYTISDDKEKQGGYVLAFEKFIYLFTVATNLAIFTKMLMPFSGNTWSHCERVGRRCKQGPANTGASETRFL